MQHRRPHPGFLPPAFRSLTVEEGGAGAGTIIAFELRVGGQTKRFRARIDEPIPGGLLTETDLDTGAVTTFEVAPLGNATRIRIQTDLPRKDGPQGLIERALAPRMLRPLYEQELDSLNDYAQEQVARQVLPMVAGI